MTETIPALIDRSAMRVPQSSALLCRGKRITFAELAQTSARLAAGLAELGIGRGSRVGIWMPNTAFWVQTHLALARLGALAVGVNSHYPPKEAAAVLHAARAEVLVVAPASDGVANVATVSELTGLVPTVHRIVAHAHEPLGVDGVSETSSAHLFSRRPHESAARPEDPLAVFASSGSTGTPKLVVHGQGAIARHSQAVARAYGYWAPDTVVFVPLPLCGVWGYNTLLATLAAGRPAVLTERFDAEQAVRLIEQQRITSSNGPDMLLRKLLAAAQPVERIESFREYGFATFSNDSREIVNLGDSLGKTFFQLYGSSELQALMLRQPADAERNRRAEPGGVPVSERIETRIRDSTTDQLLPPGHTGMLEVRGPNTALGYLTPEGIDTSVLTDDGWVASGDLAQLADDGVRYIGRATDALRLSGFLVDPREIEVKVESHPSVAEAQVIGIDSSGGPRAVAFVRVAADDFSEQAVLEQLRSDLVSYKVPARVVPIDDFPRVDGANGPRIQRKALRDWAAHMDLQLTTTSKGSSA